MFAALIPLLLASGIAHAERMAVISPGHSIRMVGDLSGDPQTTPPYPTFTLEGEFVVSSRTGVDAWLGAGGGGSVAISTFGMEVRQYLTGRRLGGGYYLGLGGGLSEGRSNTDQIRRSRSFTAGPVTGLQIRNRWGLTFGVGGGPLLAHHVAFASGRDIVAQEWDGEYAAGRELDGEGYRSASATAKTHLGWQLGLSVKVAIQIGHQRDRDA